MTLVPANLRKQWQKEFARSVDLPIYSGTIDKEVASKSHILLAIDTAKEERLARILTQRKWGLLIVDEGHMLRHGHTARYVFAYSLRAAHRILLTATPVHNSAYDIFHQANVVRPGLLGTKAVFTETYVSGQRRVSNPQILQERLARVVRRIGREATGLPFPRRRIKHVLVENRSTLERALYDDVLSVLRGIYRRHLGSAVLVRRPSGTMQGLSQIVLVAILVLRELASHPRAAIKTLAGPLVERVKHLAKITGDGTDYEAIEKIVKRYSNRNWTKGTHSKTDLLVTQIPGLVKKHGRVIIYVEFREAQKVIVERLEQRDDVGLPKNTQVISYHGGLTLAEKDHQLERFDEHHSVCFVSTDAGGQGLNLQQGNAVVNFDFPWNPMRVEQRIGRVDRLEQKAPEVVIRNFITTDTIEQYVYQTLRKKLKVCEDVLGHLLPPIFALRRLENPYTSEDDVLGIGQIILSSENDEDLRRKFLAFDEEIDEQFKRREGTWRPERRWIDG